MDSRTGDWRAPENHPEGDFRLSESPDGPWIAFSSDRDSKKLKFACATLQTTDIYVVRTDGSGLRRVTARYALAGSPAWSADGKQVLYHEAEISTLGPERGPSQIVSIDLATTHIGALITIGRSWADRPRPVEFRRGHRKGPQDNHASGCARLAGDGCAK